MWPSHRRDQLILSLKTLAAIYNCQPIAWHEFSCGCVIRVTSNILSLAVLVLLLYLCSMYNLYLVTNLVLWLQQINKLYLLTVTAGVRVGGCVNCLVASEDALQIFQEW